MNRKSATKPPLLTENDSVILFDGVCKLCNAWSHFIIKHDKQYRFKLASVQSPEGRQLLQHFDYSLDEYETMLVIDKKTCLEKSDAFFYVMSQLGSPWRALLLFKVIPKRLRDWLYDRIALNRYQLFGKYDQCLLPTPDHNKRYLNGK
ncbi:thiol-disulfide oxidoreductase DCC family protein [Pleionea sediminis]|uniref:thiol-disulfide oxidoreductase DCC family protein n=1 Tax=Pleionea sediminis TaxID=2569479 RepID=UPI0011851764|nr:DCC1-like thiol-disulfide oxidoreductase family protein [Pleionea sediminis]